MTSITDVALLAEDSSVGRDEPPIPESRHPPPARGTFRRLDVDGRAKGYPSWLPRGMTRAESTEVGTSTF